MKDDDLLAHVPDGPVPSSHAGERLLDLVKVMARLRGPEGCPWDAEQDHRSLARHLLEEAHEVLDAIDAGDSGRLKEELGDLLLQVVFHAQMAADEGRWDVDDVAEGIVTKLIRRHPHVFGDVEVSGASEVLVNWERIKTEEKGEQHVEHDIPATLPALARAAKVQRRAAGAGFEFRTPEGALAKLHEEVGELEGVARRLKTEGEEELGERTPRSDGELNEASPERVEEELGDVLFAAVAVARSMGIDAESALRRATRTFAERYEAMLKLAKDRHLDLERLSEDELIALFREARAV